MRKKTCMNKETELYTSTLGYVLEASELSEQELLYSKKEECVDARCVLVELLTQLGFSDSKIAKHTHRTRSAVCMMRNRFRVRSQRKFVAMLMTEVSKLQANSKQVVSD